jgi:hypothetical protein
MSDINNIKQCKNAIITKNNEPIDNNKCKVVNYKPWIQQFYTLDRTQIEAAYPRFLSPLRKVVIDLLDWDSDLGARYRLYLRAGHADG